MPLSVPTSLASIASEVWSHLPDRKVTSLADPTDIIKFLGKGSGSEVPSNKSLYDLIALDRLDNATYGLSTLRSRILERLTTAHFDIADFEAAYTFAHQTPQTFNDVNPHDLSTLDTIALALPAGSVLRDAILLVVIETQNQAATLNRIDVDVFTRKQGAAWPGVADFTEDDVISLPAVDAARDTFIAECDIAGRILAGGNGVYELKATIQQSAAATVKYLYWALLTLRYTMA